MTLLQKLKDDQLAARKAGQKNEAILLTTLIGEAATIGKNDGNRETNDQEVIMVIKKFVKGVDETLTILRQQDAQGSIATMEREKEILESYLPTQMSAEQLKEVLKAQLTNKGAMMKFLKENFSGQYDGKLASQVIDELLKA